MLAWKGSSIGAPPGPSQRSGELAADVPRGSTRFVGQRTPWGGAQSQTWSTFVKNHAAAVLAYGF
jgi:hypothetical protein